MSLSKPNASAATLTRNRTGSEVSPFSGLCVTCIEGCPGLCEIGQSALRGAEMLYPQPFGSVTAASQKRYPCDFSHINILGTTVGAVGVEADSDKAFFTNVNLNTTIGKNGGIKLRFPAVISGLGSTDIAKRNWQGLAIGAAISGLLLTIGENVCGMDPQTKVKDGRVVDSPDLRDRVETFKRWQRDDSGGIVLQSNVEDTRLGVLEYGISELGVDGVELKWGQGAKDIGGEVKISDLKRAQLLKERGYVVLPDPADPTVIESFERKVFKEFERHSRVGMVNEEDFVRRVEELRQAGAKYIFLKTGAYRPADLARAVKYCSLAGVDALTVDGAGGGTGMSPWRMMNEWGVPTLEIASLTYKYVNKLAQRGEAVPDIIIGGGFSLEDHIFKALALGSPYFKAVGMGRAPLAAAMVGKTIGRLIDERHLPGNIERYGTTRDEIFILSASLRAELGKDFQQLPVAAIGLYTYYERLAQGLRQMMAGARKFSLEYIGRDDLAVLTAEAARITGLSLITDVDKEEVEEILG